METVSYCDEVSCRLCKRTWWVRRPEGGTVQLCPFCGAEAAFLDVQEAEGSGHDG